MKKLLLLTILSINHVYAMEHEQPTTKETVKTREVLLARLKELDEKSNELLDEYTKLLEERDRLKKELFNIYKHQIPTQKKQHISIETMVWIQMQVGEQFIAMPFEISEQ